MLGLIARNAGSGVGGETGWLTVTLETIGDTFVTLLKAVVPPLVFQAPALDWVYRALVLLVISCPCALVISTPVSIVSALAAAGNEQV